MAARRSSPVPDRNRGGALGLTRVSYAGGVGPWWRCLRGGQCSGKLAAAGGAVNGSSKCPRLLWWLVGASAAAASGEVLLINLSYSTNYMCMCTGV
jgi:hypothetical protein